MSDVEQARLFTAKRRLLEIKEVPLSKDQPFQILIKRNGVFLHGCKTRLEVDAFIQQVPVERLMGGQVKRGKQGNTRDRR